MFSAYEKFSATLGMGDVFSYEKFSATWKWLIHCNCVFCVSDRDDWKANSSFKCVFVP